MRHSNPVSRNNRLSPAKAAAEPSDRRARALALQMLDHWQEPEPDYAAELELLEPRDRALTKQIVTGTLRMRGKIDYYLDHFLERKISSLPSRVRNILRMAVFQLKFCQRIPDYAVLNESVELAKPILGGRYANLVNGVLRRLLQRWESIELPDAGKDSPGHLAVKHSHPRWLVERYLARFGPGEAEALLEANNVQAPLVLRAEHAGADGLIRLFESRGIHAREGEYAPEAVILAESGPVSALPGYAEGDFYVQDESAMLVGRLACPGKAGVALDVCAAPGGKVTHLARLAVPGCVIAAQDASLTRLRRLKANLLRLGLSCVLPLAADARSPSVARADLVVADVPCSGTGAIRRKPGLRWRIRPSHLAALSRLQKEIISAAAQCVRPGGALIYSTCSLEPEENWEVVSRFLARNKDFYLDPADKYIHPKVVSARGCMETLPHVHHTDGAFAARLVRKNLLPISTQSLTNGFILE